MKRLGLKVDELTYIADKLKLATIRDLEHIKKLLIEERRNIQKNDKN